MIAASDDVAQTRKRRRTEAFGRSYETASEAIIAQPQTQTIRRAGGKPLESWTVNVNFALAWLRKHKIIEELPKRFAVARRGGVRRVRPDDCGHDPTYPVADSSCPARSRAPSNRPTEISVIQLPAFALKDSRRGIGGPAMR